MNSVQHKGIGPDDIPFLASTFFRSYSNAENSGFPEKRLDEALALGEMFSPGWVMPGGGAIGRLLPGARLSEPSDSIPDSDDLLSLLKNKIINNNEERFLQKVLNIQLHKDF